MTYSRKLLCAATACVAVLATASAASAAGVLYDTFSITQGDYTSSAEPSVNGTLTGTFTGAVEPNGHIGLSDLSEFKFQIDAVGGYSNGMPSLFSFSTGTGNQGDFGSLDFAVGFGLDELCVGAAAGLLPQCNPDNLTLPSPTNGIFAFFTSPDLPSGKLFVSSILYPNPGPMQGPSSAPEPSVWALMIVGAGLVGAGLRRRSVAQDTRLSVC